MYQEMSGDLFDPDLGFDAIGHGVNLHGVMGAGIAKVFATRWPEIVGPYRHACRSGELELGSFQRCDLSPVIYNLATQSRPGADARLDAVRSAVDGALIDAERIGVERFGIPQIGCGIGGLAWTDVRTVLTEVAEFSAVTLVVVALPPGR